MLQLGILDIIHIWEVFPWRYFVPSIKVDFISFFSGTKRVIRSKLKSKSVPCLAVLKNFNIHFIIDELGYIFFSMDLNCLEGAVQADLSLTPHEEELGTLLGYPLCCSRKIKLIGENNIDAYGRIFCNDLKLRGTNLYLDVSHYQEGIALISHIPCSYTCVESMTHAHKNKSLIQLLIAHNLQDVWVRMIKSRFFSHDADLYQKLYKKGYDGRK